VETVWKQMVTTTTTTISTNNNNNNNNSFLYFSVLHQQPNGQLQIQHKIQIKKQK
jgi:hypothetical protein